MCWCSKIIFNNKVSPASQGLTRSHLAHRNYKEPRCMAPLWPCHSLQCTLAPTNKTSRKQMSECHCHTCGSSPALQSRGSTRTKHPLLKKLGSKFCKITSQFSLLLLLIFFDRIDTAEVRMIQVFYLLGVGIVVSSGEVSEISGWLKMNKRTKWVHFCYE